MNPTTTPPATPSAADRELAHDIWCESGNGQEKIAYAIAAHTAAAVESQRVELVKMATRAGLAEADRDRAQSRIAALEWELAENLAIRTGIQRVLNEAEIVGCDQHEDVAILLSQRDNARNESTVYKLRAEAAERQLAEAQRGLAEAKTVITANDEKELERAGNPFDSPQFELRTALAAATQLAAQRAGEAQQQKDELVRLAVELKACNELCENQYSGGTVSQVLGRMLTSLRAQLTQEQEAHNATKLEAAHVMRDFNTLLVSEQHDLARLITVVRRNCQYLVGESDADCLMRNLAELRQQLTLAQQRAECADRLAEALKRAQFSLSRGYPEAANDHIDRALTAYAALPPAQPATAKQEGE